MLAFEVQMSQIAAWHARLGLSKYAKAFAAHGVDFEVLRHLSEEDLKELGLPLGPRRKVLAALAEAAERRQLTVLFADLVGSTQLSGRLDPEALSAVVKAYQNAVAGEIARLGGHVAKFMGDGVLAYFGWPIMHEHEAERAIWAGLAIVQAVKRLATPAGEPLSCRVGIATGLVVVGERIGEQKCIDGFGAFHCAGHLADKSRGHPVDAGNSGSFGPSSRFR
jgi:class 3 adenylate cyclase